MTARAVLSAGFVLACAFAWVVTLITVPRQELLFVAILAPAFVVAPVIGALILDRQPGNRIGWLFCLVGIGLAATMSLETASVAAFRDVAPRLMLLGLWASQWSFLLFAVPGALLIMTFPTGRLPSPRWRPVVVAFVVVAAVNWIGLAFGYPVIGSADGTFPNPVAAPEEIRPLLIAASEVGNGALALTIIPVAVAVVVRMRRAVGVERLQLKWFAYAVALLGIAIPAATFLSGPISDVGWLSMVLGFGAGLPLAAGIAILRYRLYDIDVVIRRTLVYGVLVAILGAAYGALVLALTAVLSSVTGGETLPVALATLAIAALFGPVRSRVRGAVDRRFYRSRYDAQRSIERLSTALRDVVELEAAGETLRAAADEAVKPTSLGVWLRRPAP
jgi:hypothetical protein